MTARSSPVRLGTRTSSDASTARASASSAASARSSSVLGAGAASGTRPCSQISGEPLNLDDGGTFETWLRRVRLTRAPPSTSRSGGGSTTGPSPLSGATLRVACVRYLITGGSGYIGSRLVDPLSDRAETTAIAIADVRPPKSFRPKTTFARIDVRDRHAVRELVERERPDCVVHLAFLLNPIHDEAAMYDVDVNGTQNVLEAAAAAGVQQMLVTSSRTAYGAFADNEVPLTEEHPVRGAPDFSYARDKADADRLCQLWALEHPEGVMTIVRPCIVFGPEVDNYIVRLWLKNPFRADFGFGTDPLQFVHVDDVAAALILLLEGRHAGAFNVAGDGYVSVVEASDLIGLKTRRVPYKLIKRLAGALWKTHVTEAPAGQLEFVIHPWVASNEKLKTATGWSPRWTSREVFELTMKAKGKLAGSS